MDLFIYTLHWQLSPWYNCLPCLTHTPRESIFYCLDVEVHLCLDGNPCLFLERIACVDDMEDSVSTHPVEEFYPKEPWLKCLMRKKPKAPPFPSNWSL